jgi:hypothetical protein
LKIVLIFGGGTSNAKPILKGGYQSGREGSGDVVVLSFKQDDSS